MEKYSVVFTGKIMDGLDLDSVKSNISSKFKLPEQKVNNMFQQGEFSIKKYSTQQEAEKLIAVFKECGVICFIEGLDNVLDDIELPETNTTTQGQENNTERNESKLEDVKNCPMCGEEILATAKKCKHCGSRIMPTMKEDWEARPLGRAIIFGMLAAFASAILFNILFEITNVGGSPFIASFLILSTIGSGIYIGKLLGYRTAKDKKEIFKKIGIILTSVFVVLLISSFFDGKNSNDTTASNSSDTTASNSDFSTDADGYSTYNSEIFPLKKRNHKFEMYDAYDDSYRGTLEISNGFLIETDSKYNTQNEYAASSYQLPSENCIGKKKSKTDQFGKSYKQQNYLCRVIKDYSYNATSYSGSKYTINLKNNDLFYGSWTGIYTFYKLKKLN